MLPRRWTTSILPAELPSISREIVTNIRAEISEYRRAMDGPYGRSTRNGVEQALLAFLSQIVDRASFTPEHEELFRSLGRTEAVEGRSPDVLQAAYRIGSLTAWKRISAINERAPLPPETVAKLAAAVFTFVDHLAALSTQGFREAELARSEHANRLRARLLQMLLDQPATPLDAIEGLADQIGWTLPDRIVAIDVREAPATTAYDPATLFGPDALLGLELPPPTVVLPAPLSDELHARLTQAPSRARFTIGTSVPIAQARQSLQLAQLAARLRQTGVLPDEQLTRCEDHLPMLMLQSNPGMVDLLVERRLGPLLALSAPKRLKFGRLLSAWLEYGGSQAELADELDMHRQTIHYQFVRLNALFGTQLRDRSARIEMMLALHSVLPEWERAENGTSA